MLEHPLSKIRLHFSVTVAGFVLVMAVIVYFIVASNLEATLRHVAGRNYSAATYFFEYKLPEYAHDLIAPSEAVARPSGTAASVPVLLYHGEGATADMSIARFVEHMRALKNAGWNTITLEQFTAFMKGTGTIPDKSFLLTFDDGRRDTFYAVDPVLKDLHFTAVMFVITAFSMPNNGQDAINNFYLSKDELSYLNKSGRWELESHGAEDHRVYNVPSATSTAVASDFTDGQHFLSNLFWLSDASRIETADEFTTRVTKDLADSKQLLETDFGKPVTAFAYPFNDFGEDTLNFPGSRQILDTVVPKEYTFAFYQTWSGDGDKLNYPDPKDYFIKRIEPTATWSGADLLSVLNQGRTKVLPFQSTDFHDDWDGSNWGTIALGSTLSLSADPDTAGAASFLGGSGNWRNYRFTATLDWIRGTTVSLLARHIDNETAYIGCAFSNDQILVEEHNRGSVDTLGSTPYAFNGNKHNATFTLSVSGGTATCAAYGASVSAVLPASVPRTGGIGVEVWSEKNNSARMEIKSVLITPI